MDNTNHMVKRLRTVSNPALQAQTPFLPAGHRNGINLLSAGATLNAAAARPNGINPSPLLPDQQGFYPSVMKTTIIVAEAVLVEATASLLLHLPRDSASLSMANRRRARPTAIRGCLLAPLVAWQLEMWVQVWLKVQCVCRISTRFQ